MRSAESVSVPSLLDALDNHAGHLGDLALGIFLDDGGELVDASLGVAVVQQAETVDEEELGSVLAQREPLGRELRIGVHLVEAVVLEGFVGGSIERVFDVFAEARVLGEVGVGKQYGPFAFGIVGLHAGETAVGARVFAPA